MNAASLYGRALAALGQTEAAQQTFRTLLQLDPADRLGVREHLYDLHLDADEDDGPTFKR